MDSRGMAALARRQKAAAGRTVTYTRGGVGYSFTAWPGSQNLQRQPTATDGATVVRAEAVYLFVVADAVAAGLAMPPQRGDRLTDPTLGTGGKVYEVQTPTGERGWRFQDHDDTIARVVCQRAGSA